jgi:thioredoxin reductase (NADPH)
MSDGAGGVEPAAGPLPALPPELQAGHPVLTDLHLSVLRGYGDEREMVEGEVLFADGDESYDLIVLLEGEVEIVQRYGAPDPVVLASYGRHEFLGEMGLLTGQRAYLTAVARVPGRSLRISPDQARVIMAQEPDLSEIILRAFLVRHARLTFRGAGLTLVGSRFDADTRRLLEVLARGRLPSRWLDLESSAEAETLLRDLEVPVSDLPIVIVQGGTLLRNPSRPALLAALGLTESFEDEPPGVCDLLVVGGGPAGLAAAVYGASEGMATTLAEDTALGGQAGTSSRIENYLGFPAGLSGEELAARAGLQAEKFGVRIRQGARAVALGRRGDLHEVRFEHGETITAKAVIIATGARYNRLPLARLSEFEGVGVYYAATQMEAQMCSGGAVVIVGGGNSAGQAALFLARTCTSVRLVIRSESLAASMSRYLIDQIERHPDIEVTPRTEVIALVGRDHLEGVQLRDNSTQEVSVEPIGGLFVFIGAKPSTAWIEGQLAHDDHGFLLTGSDVPPASYEGTDGVPLFLESSRPGIFCVGDVRSRSVKRVATAIGEGSMAVRLVFERMQSAGVDLGSPPTGG